MEKKVSVIIPTYNDSNNLIKAIESVLSQTYPNIEIIVVDDGSTDDTRNILSSYIDSNKIIYLYQKNSSVGVARENGVKISNGEYIAYLDSDDRWIDNDKIKQQVLFLENNTDYVLVGTGVVNVDKNNIEINRYLMPQDDTVIREKLLRINCFINSSVLFRKEIFEKIEKTQSPLEDYDTWLKIGNFGKMHNLPIFSLEYKVSFSGYGTLNKIKRLKENLVLSKKYKANYPNYYRAIILGYLKIIFYFIYKLLPFRTKVFLLKIHKKL